MSTNKTFLTGGLTFHSLKPCDLSNTNKNEIRAYFLNSYELNDSIFTSLIDTDYLKKAPDRLRLPLIFYYGHTACVYVNKLMLAGLLKPEDRVNFEFETLLETGVDEMSWDDTENYRMGGKFEWPDVKDIVAYRRQVKQVILDIIDKNPLDDHDMPITKESPWWSLFMGFEHERIHIETSSVLLRQMPVDMVQKPEGWVYAPFKHGSGVYENPMLSVEETNVTLGKPENFPSYGWDNEYGQVQSKVPRFKASKYLVTNREFLKFVEAGGYVKQEYWSDEGWKWVQYRKPRHPTFWVCDQGCVAGCGGDMALHSHCKPNTHVINGKNAYCNGHDNVDGNGHQGKDEGGGHLTQAYRYRAMFDVLSMPWDWPVEVNFLEAKAFCKWKGPNYRLPLEAEHNVLRGKQKPLSEGVISDIIYQDDIPANLNLKYGSSTPVNMFPPTDLGFHDVFGNVWEWMEDHFNGLPGITSDFLYEDFSAPCFDGKHNVILGGSWISTGDEASRFARYAFRRHFFQHCGFRLAQTLPIQNGKVQLPVRIITDKVYVLGAGVGGDSKIPLDTEKLDYIPVCTTNTNYKYDTPEFVDKTFHLEYSSPEMPSVKVAQLALEMMAKYNIPVCSALHIGSGAGHGTFTLAAHIEQVLGVDVSARMIDACQNLLNGKTFTYPASKSGSAKITKAEAKINNSTIRGQLFFKQLTWLPNEVGFHDLVVISQLDRVLNAKSWLARQREIVNPTGLLVIAAQHWGREELAPLIGQQFMTLECYEVALPAPEIRPIKVTFWKHRVNKA